MFFIYLYLFPPSSGLIIHLRCLKKWKWRWTFQGGDVLCDSAYWICTDPCSLLTCTVPNNFFSEFRKGKKFCTAYCRIARISILFDRADNRYDSSASTKRSYTDTNTNIKNLEYIYKYALQYKYKDYYLKYNYII